MQCFFLIGLGLFEEGRNYDGCLTPFDQEERLLWEYLRCPGDAFTLKIVQYMPLHAGPLQLFAAVRFRNRVARDTRAGNIRQSEGHFWSALDLQDTLVDPPVGASPDTGPATAREVVASWGIAPHHAAARIGGCRRRAGAAVNTIEMPACALCFLLVQPLAELLDAHNWGTIMLLARDLHEAEGDFLHGWPSKDWLTCAARSPSLLRSDVAVSPAELRHFADSLRSWVPSLLAPLDCESAEHDETVACVSKLTRFLDSVAADLDPGSARHTDIVSTGRGGWRFDPKRIVDCMQLANATRRRSHSKRVTNAVINLVCPQALQHAMRKRVSTPHNSNSMEPRALSMPHFSQLSRAQLTLDCAYMLWFRRHITTEPACECWKADCSPQISYDLFMSQVTRVHLRHLLLAADTVDRLAQDLLPNGPASDDRIANSALLYTFINTHRQPMQAIGSRAGSIEHKLSAFLQSMRLESADSLVMDQRCQQAVSFTTDMGTELSIGSYLLPDHRTLLPTWLREDVADVLEDDGGLCQCGSSPQRASGTSLFPRALVVAGLQHMLSNAQRDAHAVLQHWAVFVQQLKEVTQFVDNADNRRRFCARCLTGSLVPLRSFFFPQGCGLVYEHRWGVVVDVLKKLLPLEK